MNQQPSTSCFVCYVTLREGGGEFDIALRRAKCEKNGGGRIVENHVTPYKDGSKVSHLPPHYLLLYKINQRSFDIQGSFI